MIQKNRKSFWSLSKRERLGLLWLSFILLALEIGGRVYYLFLVPTRHEYVLTIVHDTAEARSPERVSNSAPMSARPYRADRAKDPPKKYGKPEELRRSVLLNETDTMAWEALPGIGPVYARRILKFRKLLGGYAERNQLNEVYGLDTSETWYSMVQEDRAPLDSLRLNSDSVSVFWKHPYVHPKIAWEWIRYREKMGRFKSLEEVREGYLMTDSLFRKIAPYLSLQ